MDINKTFESLLISVLQCLILIIINAVFSGTWTVQFGNSPLWKVTVARYILCLLLIKGARKACALVLKAWRKQPTDAARLYEENKCYGLLFAGTAATLVSSGEAVLGGELLPLLLADLIVMFPDVEGQRAPGRASSISYGTGMACSYLEGYLMQVLPGDGAGFLGLEGNIRRYEAREGVVFPVKKLFVVITKTLYCPRDLNEFNIPNRDDLPYLEAMKSLEDVTKDVAGVKNRQYRNSAYKIRRAGGAAPLHLVAECASPLNTLHRVLEKKQLYDTLADACVPEIVHDFCTTLESIIERSLECRGKCQLVFFDNEDPTQNLAQVLLDKVAELEPNFEKVIAKEKELRE